MTEDSTLRTCRKCGWVASGVSRAFAQAGVDKFNSYFDSLTTKQQSDYYGGKSASIRDYEHCGRCGGLFTNFRPFRAGDCPDGCTLNPIIVEEPKP